MPAEEGVPAEVNRTVPIRFDCDQNRVVNVSEVTHTGVVTGRQEAVGGGRSSVYVRRILGGVITGAGADADAQAPVAVKEVLGAHEPIIQSRVEGLHGQRLQILLVVHVERVSVGRCRVRRCRRRWVHRRRVGRCCRRRCGRRRHRCPARRFGQVFRRPAALAFRPAVGEEVSQLVLVFAADALRR